MYNVNMLHVLMIFVFYNFCDVPDEKASGRAFSVGPMCNAMVQHSVTT